MNSLRRITLNNIRNIHYNTSIKPIRSHGRINRFSTKVFRHPVNNKVIHAITAGLACTVLTGISYQYAFTDNSSTVVSEADNDDDLPTFSHKEVSEHNTAESAWIIIDGLVYDITSLLDQHPGGDGILLSHAGKDVSKQFQAMQHSEIAMGIRRGLLIGKVSPIETITKEKDNITNAEKKKKVVIVGAGICGISAAYFLSQNPTVQSNWDVSVVDGSPMVGGTGLKSSAIMYLGPILEKNDKDITTVAGDEVPKPKMTLTQWLGEEAYSFYKIIQNEWQDVHFADKGTVGIIENDEQFDTANAIFGVGGRVKGAEVVTDPTRIKEIEPAINPEQVKAIVYHQRGATVDPFLVCDSFAKRATKNGVNVMLQHEVQRLERVQKTDEQSNDTFIVHTVHDGKNKQIDADVLIICTGWKAKDFAKQLDHDVPVKAMHGQMFAISCPDLELKNNIYGLEGVTHWRKNRMRHQATRESEPPYTRITNHLYGVQISNGIFKFGGDRVLGDLDGKVLMDGIEDNYNTVVRIFPKFKGIPILGSWSGTMPFTPDQKIICGELEHNLFVLTGSGFMRGLASGRLLADSIVKTQIEDSVVDPLVNYYLGECSPKRFNKKKDA